MACYNDNYWLINDDFDDEEVHEKDNWNWYVSDYDSEIDLPIRDIRFTHGVISRKFRVENRGNLVTAPEGPSLEQTFKDILENRDIFQQLPNIPVMYHNGHYWAVNGNRRLYVYKMLASHGVLDTITVIEKPFNAEWFNKAYSTTNKGMSVTVRGVVMLYYEEHLKSIYMTHLKSKLTNLSGSSIRKTPLRRRTDVISYTKESRATFPESMIFHGGKSSYESNRYTQSCAKTLQKNISHSPGDHVQHPQVPFDPAHEDLTRSSSENVADYLNTQLDVMNPIPSMRHEKPDIQQEQDTGKVQNDRHELQYMVYLRNTLLFAGAMAMVFIWLYIR